MSFNRTFNLLSKKIFLKLIVVRDLLNNKNYQHSTTYKKLLKELAETLNTLPPSHFLKIVFTPYFDLIRERF